MRGGKKLHQGQRCVYTRTNTHAHSDSHAHTGQGDKLHVSGFVSYPDGRWADIETIEPSKDGNWTLEKLVIQTRRVLDKLKTVYPATDYEIIFTFDHSHSHEDARRCAARHIDGFETGW